MMICVEVEVGWEDCCGDVTGREEGAVHGGNSRGPTIDGVGANDGVLGNETGRIGGTLA